MGILTPDPKQTPHLDTSQQIKHVFICSGTPAHIMPGFALLRAGSLENCPHCGASVRDCTDSFVGKCFLKFAGFTREDRQ
jgi:hypothetical protein